MNQNPNKTQFLGLETSYDNAESVIIPVPYERTATWLKGTAEGPQRILEASLQLEGFNYEMQDVISEKVGIHTLEELDIREKNSEDMIESVNNTVSKVLNDVKKPVLLGGEHSISIGAVQAMHKTYSSIAVLSLDAHADLRNEFLGNKYNHGCTMRRIREIAKQVVQVGVRSYSKEEDEYIREEGINQEVIGVKFDVEEIIDQLPEEIYVSVDLDVFDPSEVPAVGTLQPGGLMWRETLDLLKEIGDRKTILGFDITELSPREKDVRSEFLAAKLTYMLMGYSFTERFKD